MEPGHGYKGKQRWITCNEDLQDMYEANCMKKEILLWCFLPDKEGPIGKKRSSDTADSSSGKRTKCEMPKACLYCVSAFLQAFYLKIALALRPHPLC